MNFDRRIYNFSAGPAVLPEEVLREAQGEMLNYRASGMSVMEMSHRGSCFEEIISEARSSLARIINLPSNYEILFLQGGATLQFAAIPLNLARSKKAGYVLTGMWANKAYKEGLLFLDARVVASSEDENYSYIPSVDEKSIDQEFDYLHICENNTIYGTKYDVLPKTGVVPLVADMSSCFLSEEFDISSYGVVYAGAQKNIGPAGVTVVIVRKDLIQAELSAPTPSLMRWDLQAEAHSLYNTPPAYGIYMCGKVFKWIEQEGGLAAMGKRNHEKAQLLYDFLDQSKLFSATVKGSCRSRMNIPFVTGNDVLDKEFLVSADEAGLANLKGHRSVGGMRASLYNAMTIDGVRALVTHMDAFERAHR